MKPALISTLLLALSLSLNAQLIDSVYSFYSFKYSKVLFKKLKVKSITVTSIDKKNDDSSRIIYHFNKEGILTEQINYGEDGNIESSYQFFVNEYHQKIKEITKRDYKEDKDSIVYYKTYKRGKLIKDSNTFIPSHQLYEYSKSGVIIKLTEATNSVFPRTTKKIRYYEYDQKNRLIHTRDSLLQPEGKNYCFSDRTYHYDEKGRLQKEIEKIHLSFPAEKNSGNVLYNYDELGRIESIVVEDGMSQYFTYNKKGLIVKKLSKLYLKPDMFTDTDIKVDSGDEYTYTFW